MNRRTIQQIVSERLLRWNKVMVQEHSTPALTISIGHDHRSGTLGLMTCEEIDNATIVALLKWAIREIESGRAHTNTPVPD